jgi:adenylylsulfate kinase
MAFKILIMGLPGSGKTTLSRMLVKELSLTSTVVWLNADEMRSKYRDWDFSNDGRLRQAQRMFNFCEWRDGYSKERTEDFAVVDFVAPIPKSRSIFAPNYTIWMNTIDKCRFDDTQQLFLDPLRTDYTITEFNDTNAHVKNISNTLQTL